MIFRILLKLEARRVKVVSTVPREVVAEKKRSRDKSAEQKFQGLALFVDFT